MVVVVGKRKKMSWHSEEKLKIVTAEDRQRTGREQKAASERNTREESRVVNGGARASAQTKG